MQDPLLEIEDLTVKYATRNGDLTAVSDANLTIQDGTYFGLAGESGCGKSTLAKAIMGGLDSNGKITSGTIRYKGTEIQNLTEKQYNKDIRWTEISWIPQSAMNSLDPLQRVQNQALEIANVHTDLSEADALDKLKAMFRAVDLPEERIADYPHQFSGGMQQRALIAFALFLEPDLIIADEPTTALDVIMQDEIFEHLDNLNTEFNTSMLLITHDISVIFESCSRISIMHAGQIAETGDIDTVYDSPRHPYSILLQEAFPDIRYPDRELEVIQGNPPELIGDVDFCTFADRCPWATDDCREAAPPLEQVGDRDQYAACIRQDAVQTALEEDGEMADHQTDHRTATQQPHTDTDRPGADEELLRVENLHKYFDQGTSFLDALDFRSDPEPIKAVDDVSLSIGANESKAIIGESGCGKTTFLKTLIGLLDPTAGDIYFKGQPLSEFSRSQMKEFRNNVQIIFQDPFNSLDPKMTVEESLNEQLQIHNLDRNSRIEDTLDLVELTPPSKYLDKVPHELSGGELQRASIARALIVEPDILLADEPVSMLDVSTQAAILKTLSNLIEELNLSMLYISHDLSTVSYISDHTYVMYRGRIVEDAPTADLISDPLHPYSQALINAIPIPDPHYNRRRTSVEGTPSDPIGIGEGCRFRDRCPERMDICEQTPAYLEEGDNRNVACHLYDDSVTHDPPVSGGVYDQSDSNSREPDSIGGDP